MQTRGGIRPRGEYRYPRKSFFVEIEIFISRFEILFEREREREKKAFLFLVNLGYYHMCYFLES